MAMALAYAQVRAVGQEALPIAFAFANAKSPLGRNPFGCFKKDGDSELYLPQREGNTKLGDMLRAWDRFNADVLTMDEVYYHAMEAVRGIKCSSKDLAGFVAMLPELEGEEGFGTKAGVIVSAFIHQGPEDVYIVVVPPVAGLDYLGIYNSLKHIVIVGDAGYDTGSWMTSGSILVTGDVGDQVGISMAGGNIIVNGNAGHAAGSHMRGGSLTVLGNSGPGVGGGMKNGEIRIEGKCEGIDHRYIPGGKIFVGGRQIQLPPVPELTEE